jgi:hypothetical protein
MTETPLTSGVIIEEIMRNKMNASLHFVVQNLVLTILKEVRLYIKIGRRKRIPVINSAASDQLMNSSTGRKDCTKKSSLKARRTLNIDLIRNE